MTEQVGQVDTQPCDLCGLPIEGAPYVLETPERRYRFCCDGCLGIYQMLHDIDTVITPTPGASTG